MKGFTGTCTFRQQGKAVCMRPVHRESPGERYWRESTVQWPHGCKEIPGDSRVLEAKATGSLMTGVTNSTSTNEFK